MLVEFSFGNFRSFKEQTTLSLVAASKLRATPELDSRNVFAVPQHPHLSLLRVAALYGANASGKSNVFQALDAFRFACIYSADIGFLFDEKPFLLDMYTRFTSTHFEMILILDGVQYRYGFEMLLDETQTIHAEWLYRATSSRETLLFERTRDRIERGRAFTEGTSLIKEKTLKRKEALFLSLATQTGEEISSRIVAFLRQSIRLTSGLEDKHMLKFTENCLEHGLYRDIITRLLRGANTGIDDFRLGEKRNRENGSVAHRATARGSVLPIVASNYQDSRARTESEYEIQTKHTVFRPNGEAYEPEYFPMSSFESQGTQKLFAFAGPIADTLTGGLILFVDEMDARFHPLVTKALIALFQSSETNPKNAQLIFITHDTNLLDTHSLRRDQIWFVEKDGLGVSRLYSLAEFKGVRNKASFEGDYFAGRYGGIPLLGDLTRLFNADTSGEAEEEIDETIDHAEP